MRKRVFIMILVALLLPVLVACGPSGETPSDPAAPLSSNNYEIFIVSSEGDGKPYFGEAVISYRELYTEGPQPTPLKQQEIQIDGVRYEMEYSRTYESAIKTYTYHYKTSDGKVDCLYWAADMQLARLLLMLDLADFAGMDQQQYEQWIQNLISQYVQEDWSDYQLSCQTLRKKLEDGFLTEPEDGQSVQRYEFRYEKYINSMETTDNISAMFDIDEDNGVMKVVIWLSRHEFDQLDTIEIDETAIEAAIDAFLTQNTGDKITLDSWEMLEGSELSMINGNVMLTRRVAMKYKWNGVRNNITYELMIDIPDP